MNLCTKAILDRLSAAIATLVLLGTAVAAPPQLDLEFAFHVDERPIVPYNLATKNAAGQNIAFWRLDFLVADVALQNEAERWVELPDSAGFINWKGGQTRFTVPVRQAGKYRRLRFHVGVSPEINKSNPATYPAGHALNPTVNGLHWGWQGGYVFAAIEGKWLMKKGGLGGFSYHIANDWNLMTVELPLDLDLSRDQTVTLRLDADKIFTGLTITDETASTHSRKEDALAVQIRDNFVRAFSLSSVAPTATRAERAAKLNALIAPDASEVRLSFSPTFPKPKLPPDNPLTKEGIALGKRLFHEAKLSGNNTQSCSSCHQPAFAFSDARRFSSGAEGAVGVRNAMPLFNLAWKSAFFWDGRAPSLRLQVSEPIQNPIEMHSTLPEVVSRLAQSPGYPPMFKAAFGTPEVTFDRVARALEQFLLTLVSHDSKFDRAFGQNGEILDGGLTREEQRGLDLFNMEFDPAQGLRGADCFHCHGGALFASLPFANNGLRLEENDSGRLAVSRLDGDRGKFAVPSLRNVALTAPYMHDGRFATLEEVIEHYDHGVERGPNLDPNLAKHPAAGLGLSQADKKALVAFLRTLTDDGYAKAAK